jgi:hypothetical protein
MEFVYTTQQKHSFYELKTNQIWQISNIWENNNK